VVCVQLPAVTTVHDSDNADRKREKIDHNDDMIDANNGKVSVVTTINIMVV
jgi:hypothetical protein